MNLRKQDSLFLDVLKLVVYLVFILAVAGFFVAAAIRLLRLAGW